MLFVCRFSSCASSLVVVVVSCWRSGGAGGVVLAEWWCRWCRAVERLSRWSGFAGRVVVPWHCQIVSCGSWRRLAQSLVFPPVLRSGNGVDSPRQQLFWQQVGLFVAHQHPPISELYGQLVGSLVRLACVNNYTSVLNLRTQLLYFLHSRLPIKWLFWRYVVRTLFTMGLIQRECSSIFRRSCARIGVFTIAKYCLLLRLCHHAHSVGPK